jgi:hypothetical protein
MRMEGGPGVESGEQLPEGRFRKERGIDVQQRQEVDQLLRLFAIWLRGECPFGRLELALDSHVAPPGVVFGHLPISRTISGSVGGRPPRFALWNDLHLRAQDQDLGLSPPGLAFGCEAEQKP